MPSKDANKLESTITTYAKVVKHLLRGYATDAVIVRSTRKFAILKKADKICGIAFKCYGTWPYGVVM